MPSNETKLVAQIGEAIQKAYPSAWVFKVVGSPFQMTGVPDLLALVESRFFGLEVKHQKPGESEQHAYDRTTAGQHLQIRRINQAGGIARTILSKEEAIETIEAFLDDFDKESD